jgi:1,6-anhydro-N-acetylmuramate kinase
MEQPLQTGKGQMTDKTAIQRIQELDRERATLFEQAKEEALCRATQAVEDLNAVGLKYRLVEGEPAAESKGVGKTPQKGQAEKKSAAR